MVEITGRAQVIGTDSALFEAENGKILHLPYYILSAIDALKIRQSDSEIKIIVPNWIKNG